MEMFKEEHEECTNLCIEDFGKVCRLCLSPKKIHPIRNSLVDNQPAGNLIKSNLLIEVLNDDGRPQNICENCLKVLYCFSKLKTSCELSEAAFTIILEEQSENKDLLAFQEVKEVKKDEPTNIVTENTSDNTKDFIEMDEADIPNPIKNIIKCNICGVKFVTQSEVMKHLKREHRVRFFYSCMECNKKITLPCKERHIAYHRNQNLFRCELCPKGFSQSGALDRHMLLHTDERPFICSKCGQSFKYIHILRKHEKNHETEKPLYCAPCKRSFKSVGGLCRHQLTHSGKKAAFNAYICEKCGVGFSTRSYLTLHQRVHTEKSIVCEECGRMFRSRVALKGHAVTHTGEKSYVCTVCKKAFAHPSSLNKHMTVHSGLKRHSCTLCPKKFTSWSSLKFHQAFHTGARPFTCEYCTRTFRSKSILKRHIMVIHKKEDL